MPWTEEQKQQAIDAYKAAEPTPETSIEIVKAIAEDIGQTPNGVRNILSKAEVYLKKASTSAPSGASGSTRVSKKDSQDALAAAILDAGKEVDEEIISKLTGKAAVYLTKLFE